MNGKEKLEVIKHITLGTNEVLYYPYAEGKQPLPLRPISSFEFDQCLYKALEYAPSRISEFVIKFKLGLIKKDQNIDISDEGYVRLQEYSDRLDYWIVFYAMKDFQNENFSKPDYSTEETHPKGYYEILKMKEVHEISEFIMRTSHRTKEVIEEIFIDEAGREVAYLYFYLKVPLAEMSKMTKLQRDYLIYSKGEVRKITAGKQKESGYILSDQKMTVKDFLDKMGVGY